MRKISILLLMCISISSYGQTALTAALGIDFGSPPSTIKAALNSMGTFDEETSTLISYADVQVGTTKAILCNVGIIDNKMHTLSLYYTTQESQLQSTYDKIVDIINSKYGEGDSFRNFSGIYTDGDDFESQAIRLGYADIVTYWKFDDGNIICCEQEYIGSAFYVSLTYQDSKLINIAVERAQAKNNSKF